ncbi:Rv0340 family IniB-related protein [Mycobacterium sp. smrl_JER01]|uniref:Rv0340 family IniB-related protein n=1 Tax=Mycobacterium sp. smrl_JER01 TaxID=3402633 RepID=UPI003AD791F6
MANALLDFVMSLVRDPEAAARYAADPAGALADADLTGVTGADVQNLIPVVAESLSMVAPVHGLDAFDPEPAGNVWASGAATAAFDAFDDVDGGHPGVSVPAVIDPGDLVGVPAAGLDDAMDLAVDVASDPAADVFAAQSDPLDAWSQAADFGPPNEDPPNGGVGFDPFD